jgi:uncharacterized surface protein with fasciclin (FAS1) repeats
MKRAIASLILASLLMTTLPLNVAADETEDIPANAAATGVHDSLVAALTHANLVTTLQGDGPFTVFAPTDAAFADAGINLADFDSDEENATLVDILTYHVFSGQVASADVTDGMEATMLNGDKAVFTVGTDESVMIEGANVTTADVLTSNGIIHIIDSVMMPPLDSSNDIYVDGGSMSSPYYTFYTDSAGTTVLTDNVLDIMQTYTFHRLNSATSHPFFLSDAGYEQTATTALMLSGDGSATSGITGSESFTLSFDPSIPADATLSYFCTVHSSMISQFNLVGFPVTIDDIPTVAQSTGVHASLVSALSKANLVATLQGPGPFTVFAPTDTAFSDAGIDLTLFETDEEIAVLADILLYHVFSGAVASTDVTDGLTVTMENGDDATFSVAAGGAVMVGDANVIQADVQASNGIIHVIDTVLMPPTPLEDIPTVATNTGIHTALVAALAQADLVTALQAEGPFTVFAPTDAAFQAAGINLSEYDTPDEISVLTTILTYHVFAGAVASSEVTDGLTVTMLNGENATFSVTNGAVMVGGATVTLADVQASNGVIHVIDAVLMPPSLTTTPGPAGEICYNVMTHMIVAGADQATCGAFMYLENYSMNGQEVTGCYNSITHAVSNVSQAVCESYTWTPSVDIAMTAGATGIHTSLVAALAQANLVATLQGDGPFTVFAPTDAAFTAAGINLDDFTTDAQIAALADILLFHVVSGQVNAADVTDGLVAAAVNGDNLSFTVLDGAVTVNGATVILADVPASNGVIHVIDAVLMPPADAVVEPVLADCDATVRIAPSGLKFSPSEVTITAGQTVCWQWENESMAHNMREVDGDESTTFAVNGVTSGESSSTVDFRYTFDVDSTTFYFACEPHLASGMFGKVIVGDGGITPPMIEDNDMDSDEESVPGFLAVMTTIALAGAAFVSSRRTE